jgi:hypothetical protein
MSEEPSVAKHIYSWFDHFEDRVRGHLSRFPIVYSIIGGVAIVLFWRGVWMTADLFPWLTGPVSVAISVVILLTTGLFVSFFITDRIIVSGIKQEKKLAEKTAEQVQEEGATLHVIQKELANIEKELQHIQEDMHKHHPHETN